MNQLVAHEMQGGALTAADMRAQVQRIQEIMHEVMKKDVHFGNIPGTDKPSLLKAGAEKLCMVFRFGPDYEIVDKEREGDHLTITSKCTLTHIPTGLKVGSALGSCSTMESKYAYRKGVRKCPQCGKEAIIKGKAEFGGGWFCFAKKEGCGAKFSDGDPAIEDQQTGRVANEDKADQFNTVLKMSNKRALLAAVLNATAASDIFNQDLLDDDGEITTAGEDAARRAPEKRTIAEPKKKAAVPAGPVNETQLRVIHRKIEAANLTAEQVCKEFKIDSLPELPFAKINDVLAWLDKQAQP